MTSVNGRESGEAYAVAGTASLVRWNRRGLRRSLRSATRGRFRAGMPWRSASCQRAVAWEAREQRRAKRRRAMPTSLTSTLFMWAALVFLVRPRALQLKPKRPFL